MGTVVAAVIGAVATLLAVWLRYWFEEKRRAETRKREPAKHEAAQALRFGFEFCALRMFALMQELSDGDGREWPRSLYRKWATDALETGASRVKKMAASIPIGLPKGLSPENLGNDLIWSRCLREVTLQLDAKPAKVRAAYEMGTNIGSIQLHFYILLYAWGGYAEENNVQHMQNCSHHALELARELMTSRKMVKRLKEITSRLPRAFLKEQFAPEAGTSKRTLPDMWQPMSEMYTEFGRLVDALALELES